MSKSAIQCESTTEERAKIFSSGARHEPYRGGGRRACYVTPDLSYDYDYSLIGGREKRDVKRKS